MSKVNSPNRITELTRVGCSQGNLRPRGGRGGGAKGPHRQGDVAAPCGVCRGGKGAESSRRKGLSLRGIACFSVRLDGEAELGRTLTLVL